MSNKSLRFQITIICTTILVVMVILFTALSIYYADAIFTVPDNNEFQTLQNLSAAEVERLWTLELQDYQNRFRLQILLIMGLSIPLCALLIWLVTARLMYPLKRLILNMQNIDETRLTAQLPVSPRFTKEVASLTSSYNRMLSKLERAFQSQKRFSQNVAHELKTPLAAMMMNMDVLEIDEQPSVQQYAETIQLLQKQVESMNEIVTSLLSLHANHDLPERSEVNVGHLIQSILDGQMNALQSKKLTVEQRGKMVIEGNTQLLERAFANLIQNAIRYNLQGGKIIVRLSQDTASISNNSAPIAADALESIFEPFYCTDQSRSRAYGGYGLGLSIARHIFESHGYRIDASYTDSLMTLSVRKQPPAISKSIFPA